MEGEYTQNGRCITLILDGVVILPAIALAITMQMLTKSCQRSSSHNNNDDKPSEQQQLQ